MLFAAVWSFVVAPSLCRAGALAACCTHGEAQAAPVGCCQSHETSPTDSPVDSGDPPRECRTCADVCNGVAKPDESRYLPTLDMHSPSWHTVTAHCGVIASNVAVLNALPGLIESPRLPFPASGLPLRI
ncbi:MAG: hypothetical protein SF069_10940 [Phycisphaerae bacterium]|nr:hypothetical protein [Phycisphaerae bacterium]